MPEPPPQSPAEIAPGAASAATGGRISPDVAAQTIENLSQGVIVIDAGWRFTFVNGTFARMLGRSPEEFIGRVVTDFLLADDLPRLRAAQADRLKGMATSNELTAVRADGAEVPLLISGVPRHHLGEFAGTVALVTDLTERKRNERQLMAANRALTVLMECNRALVRAQRESDLLEQMCRILVVDGGYRMAWVGYAEQDAEQGVVPIAQYGFEDGYLEHARISWADTERGRGPTGTAIRSGLVQVNRDFLHNPAMAPWREQALERGYQSSIALPLRSATSVFGALTIYAARPDAFDEGEEGLLTELSNDLAYGISALREAVERRRAQDETRRLYADLEQRIKERTRELAESEARFRLALGHAPVSVAMQDRDLRFTWAYNQRTRNAAEIVGRTDQDLFPPEDAERLLALKRRVLTTGENVREHLWVTSNGRRVFIDLCLEPVVDEQGAITGVGVATVDLTGVKLAEQALRDSETKYRRFFENLQESIAILAAVRNAAGDIIDWQFQDANPAMLAGSGWTRDTLIGRRISEPAAFGVVKPYLRQYGRDLAREEGVLHDVEHAGRHFLVSVFTLDGERLACVGVDVTERKLAEGKLHAAVEELTRFNRAMVGRELRMVELKREVNALCIASGKPPRYVLEGEQPAKVSPGSATGG